MDNIMKLAWNEFIHELEKDLAENLETIKRSADRADVQVMRIDDRVLRRVRVNYETGERRARFQLLEGQLQGEYTRWYRNGTIWMSGSYNRDVHNGTHTKQRSDGSTTAIFEVKEGALHGKQTCYDGNNRPLFIRNYRYGELHGEQTDINLDGTIHSSTYEFGKIKR